MEFTRGQAAAAGRPEPRLVEMLSEMEKGLQQSKEERAE